MLLACFHCEYYSLQHTHIGQIGGESYTRNILAVRLLSEVEYSSVVISDYTHSVLKWVLLIHVVLW